MKKVTYVGRFVKYGTVLFEATMFGASNGVFTGFKTQSFQFL